MGVKNLQATTILEALLRNFCENCGVGKQAGGKVGNNQGDIHGGRQGCVR